MSRYESKLVSYNALMLASSCLFCISSCSGSCSGTCSGSCNNSCKGSCAKSCSNGCYSSYAPGPII